MKNVLLLCSLLFFCSNLWAQYVPLDNIPLEQSGNLLKNPWAGGLNLPQFSEVDLNNDGIQDLVVFDREGSVASTFINGGTVGQVDYIYAPEYMKRMPDSAVHFMLFRDYDCDGIQDIFGMYVKFGQGPGVAIWKGSYDANDTIQYTMIIDQVRYKEAGIANPYKMAIHPTDLPAVDDIDGDGDMDILSFTSDIIFSKNVFWYRNMSAENGYGCDSLDFHIETKCWGLFEEGGDSSKINMSNRTDSCANNPYFRILEPRPTQIDHIRNPRHIGANIATVDMDADGTKEMALGGVSYRNVNVVSGTTINDTVLIDAQDHLFPSYDRSVNIFSFPSIFFLDVNNDGKTDMLNAPSEQGFLEAVKDTVAWLYLNVGSNTSMTFQYQQNDFLVGEMLDIGQRSSPILFDYNGDGLDDILLGCYARPRDYGLTETGLTILENKGTLTNPSYSWVTNDYANLDTLKLVGLYPTVGDMDGDGDLDMICGEEDNGTLTYLENIAAPGSPAMWGTPIRNYKNIDVSRSSKPFLVDLDRDGDLDLVVGSRVGGIHYFENGGSPTLADFSSTPTTTNLGGYSIQDEGSRASAPFIYDNNGAYEMFIGHQNGNIIHLGNIDNNVLGTYDTLSTKFNNIAQGRHVHFYAGDITGDAKVEYLLGTERGGLIFMGEQDTLTNTTVINVSQKVTQIYPNPTNEALTISLLAPTQSDLVYITIHNALGQTVLETTKAGGQQRYDLDVSKLGAGVLFMEIKAGNYRETVQFVKQ